MIQTLIPNRLKCDGIEKLPPLAPAANVSLQSPSPVTVSKCVKSRSTSKTLLHASFTVLSTLYGSMPTCHHFSNTSSCITVDVPIVFTSPYVLTIFSTSSTSASIFIVLHHDCPANIAARQPTRPHQSANSAVLGRWVTLRFGAAEVEVGGGEAWMSWDVMGCAMQYGLGDRGNFIA